MTYGAGAYISNTSAAHPSSGTAGSHTGTGDPTRPQLLHQRSHIQPLQPAAVQLEAHQITGRDRSEHSMLQVPMARPVASPIPAARVALLLAPMETQPHRTLAAWLAATQVRHLAYGLPGRKTQLLAYSALAVAVGKWCCRG